MQKSVREGEEWREWGDGGRERDRERVGRERRKGEKSTCGGRKLKIKGERKERKGVERKGRLRRKNESGERRRVSDSGDMSKKKKER